MENSTRREFLKSTATAAATLSPLVQACTHLLRNRREERGPIKMEDIPTVELHRHFEAGLSPETIAQLAQRNKVTKVLTRNGHKPIEGVDPQDPSSIRAYYQKIQTGFTSPTGFADFLDSLGLPVGVMRTLEDIKEVARRQIREQAQGRSLHTELRGSPYTYQENLIEKATLSEIITAIRSGILQAYKESGASGGFTACVSRNKANKHGDVVKAVLQTHSSDFPIGFDIAGGPEGAFPPDMFTDLVQPLHEANVPITIHAGEQSKPPDFKETPPSFIEDAVKKLRVRRIGHGTSLIATGTDRRIWDLLREKDICIETCPVSNAAFGYMPLAHHPLREFLDAGLSATINTDDPLMFGTPSVRDILLAYGSILRLEPKDAVQMTRNGISAAFVTKKRRAELIGELDAFLSSK